MGIGRMYRPGFKYYGQSLPFLIRILLSICHFCRPVRPFLFTLTSFQQRDHRLFIGTRSRRSAAHSELYSWSCHLFSNRCLFNKHVGMSDQLSISYLFRSIKAKRTPSFYGRCYVWLIRTHSYIASIVLTNRFCPLDSTILYLWTFIFRIMEE